MLKTTFVPLNWENGEYGNEQAFQSKGRAGPEILRLVKRLYRISAGVLNGAQNGT
ncbi:MAG: hypothetical protein VZR53_13435 [Prevotella sp.]|nr:hypothetical protein [Prevotella sp.]